MNAHHNRVLMLQYEPELFPGLIYRMKVPKIVLLIFVSGKVVLTGEGRGNMHTVMSVQPLCKAVEQPLCAGPFILIQQPLRLHRGQAARRDLPGVREDLPSAARVPKG